MERAGQGRGPAETRFPDLTTITDKRPAQNRQPHTGRWKVKSGGPAVVVLSIGALNRCFNPEKLPVFACFCHMPIAYELATLNP
jgi:hypothetical protein